MAVVALDLGGTKLAAALVTSSGRVFDRVIKTLDHRSGKAVGELIRQSTRALLAAAQQRSWPVTAIGTCVPGIAHARTGRAWAPNIPGWTNYPLRQELVGIPRSPIPVLIDSDRSCCILGEAWRGAARGCRDAIYLAVGTGIGAGIMSDDQVLRGHRGIAGAIGWLALDRPFRPEYAACGCFEYHASGAGLAKVASQMSSAKHPNDVSAADVFLAYERGERTARAVVAQAVECWGMAVANLVSLFNPQKIIFGGGVFGPGLALLDEIRREAKRWAQPTAFRQVKLEGSQLGGDAALYGAAYLALRRAKEIP